MSRLTPTPVSNLYDPTINCILGDRVIFMFPANLSTYPFSIFSGSSGTTDYPGVTSNPFVGIGNVTFLCDATMQANGAARYQCTDFASMNGTINLLGSYSICDYYSNALGVNNSGLMNTLITDVVVNMTLNSTTLPYFNGARPTGSTNYAAGGVPLQTLIGQLVQFFGAALGCSDTTVTAYTGPNMTTVHRFMGVTQAVFDNFNEIVVQTAAALGVTSGDQSQILTLLQSLNSQIVFPASLCDKYAAILNVSGAGLVTVVVDNTVNGLVGNATTLPYFNGQVPAGSTDYTAGGTPLTNLKAGLVAFFAQQGVLGCTDGSNAAYTGGALNAIHSPLGVTVEAFNDFNEILTGVTAGAGVDATDNAAILALLQSLQSQIVFNISALSLCDKYTALSGSANNAALMNLIVSDTVVALVSNATTLPYFNGVQPAGSTNFLNNSIALAALQEGLVEFFAVALGCSDGSIPPYSNTQTLAQIHSPLGISLQVFNDFNELLINVLANLGVAAADRAAILSVLQSLQPQIVLYATPNSPTFPDRVIDLWPAAIGGILASTAVAAIFVALVVAAFAYFAVVMRADVESGHAQSSLSSGSATQVRT